MIGFAPAASAPLLSPRIYRTRGTQGAECQHSALGWTLRQIGSSAATVDLIILVAPLDHRHRAGDCAAIGGCCAVRASSVTMDAEQAAPRRADSRIQS